jgi:hypothetical protein
VVVVGLSLTMATEARAQYATTYLPPLPPGYVYVYPTRPAYVPTFQAVVPQYTRPPNRGPSQIASLELDTLWGQAVPSAVVGIQRTSQNR